MTTAENGIRKQLVELLRGGQAHATFEDVVKNFPPKLRGVVPQGLPYSAWQVLEHIRIAQDDIVRFSMNHDGSYHSPKWPEGYWPASAAPRRREKLGALGSAGAGRSRQDDPPGQQPRQ